MIGGFATVTLVDGDFNDFGLALGKIWMSELLARLIAIRYAAIARDIGLAASSHH